MTDSTRPAALTGFAEPDHPSLVGARVVAGPTRRANERVWQIALADGRRAVLAQLVDELGSDDSIRRRYRRDLARIASFAPEGVAPILAWGPSDDDAASLPWRLRLDPTPETLEDWLERRAPAPPDEVAAKLAALSDRLAELHTHGLVVRDLSPTKVGFDEAGQAWLLDVGLARTDILSTRTAASLVLEGSPYTAPELLTRTAVDGRADLYALGVLGFRALTGELPFGDTHALLRPPGPAPKPSSVRPGLSRDLDQLMVALMAVDPSQRPTTATLVADVLRGESELPSHDLARRECQSCGAPMPVGQRLCLGCGKLVVSFTHAAPELDVSARRKLVLRKAKEEGDFMANLRELSGQLCEGEVPTLNFVIGDARMYSEAERNRALKLPVTLFNDLDVGTAEALAQRFEAHGVKLEVQALDASDREDGGLTRTQKRSFAAVAVGTAAIVGVALAASVPVGAALLIAGLGVAAGVSMAFGFRKHNRKRREQWGRALMELRASPAALPASDPLVARIATLLDGDLADDARELVARTALLIQRMVDHRSENAGAAAELEFTTAPLAELVTALERRVADISKLDRALTEFDEGHLVRALAHAEARGESSARRADLLAGLDTLRELEVERARLLSGLSEACDLARRSIEMGLRVRDPAAEHERRVNMALLALDAESSA